MTVEWKRFGEYAAHAYVGDRHLCHTVHPLPGASDPSPAPLSPWGLPFGKACACCAKLVARRSR